MLKLLGDVCVVRRGTTITQKSATHGNIPVVAGGLKPTYFHNVSNRNANVITVSGSGANAGFVNFWTQPIFASDCSTVEVERDDLSINYVYYFLLSKQNYIYKELRSGAAQPHVYGKDIANLEIPLLSFEKQQEIVAKLDTIFAEIDKAVLATEINIKNAEALFQNYLSDTFENKGKNWAQVKVSELGRVQSGGTPPIGDKSYWNGEIQWYSSGELNNLYTKDSIRKITIDGVKNSNAKIFPENSLLIGMYDTAAMKMSLLSTSATFNQAIVGIEPSNKLNMIYLYYAFSYIKPYVLSLRQGVRQKNLSLAKIKALSIKLPSIDIQSKFANDIRSFNLKTEELKHSYFQKICHYKSLKQSILRRYFDEIVEV